MSIPATITTSPERPITERLRFLTTIFEKQDGTEQRQSVRLGARQEFDLKWVFEHDERAVVENLIWGSQANPVGIPVWTEPCMLTAAASAGAVSLTVDDTTLSDFRASSFALVGTEVVEVTSVGSTTLGVSAGTVSAHVVGDTVYPVRVAQFPQTINGSLYVLNGSTLATTLQVTEPGAYGIASTSGWPTLSGKVLLDDANFMSGTANHGFTTRQYELDGVTGIFSRSSIWLNARTLGVKTFRTKTRTALWTLRKLLFSLRGRHVSFYLPTFIPELVPVADMTSGTLTMDVANVGFTTFLNHRPNREIIRVLKTDGTSVTKTITGAAVVSATVERLTVSVAWAATIPAASVSRVDYVEKVRFDADDIVIQHENNMGCASVQIPVKSVME